MARRAAIQVARHRPARHQPGPSPVRQPSRQILVESQPSQPAALVRKVFVEPSSSWSRIRPMLY